MNKDIHFRFCSLSLSIIILICTSTGLLAQTDTLKYPEQFLFPEFLSGKIDLKDGRDFDMILNYNIISEKITFIQRGKILDLTNPGSVDTIYLGGKIFIPFGKVFYEVLSEEPFILFVQHKGIVQEPLKTDSYGRVPETSSASSMNYFKDGSDLKALLDRNFIIKKEDVYWVHMNESMQSFKDATQLVKIFPDIKSEIRLYIRQNKIKFENSDDILKLMNYCNSLIK
ncbi:MAG: hypothetical protein NTV31_16290 [Bacteroidia bacterium]|nr:hypothetical protein [Bacteroidia bacterium]